MKHKDFSKEIIIARMTLGLPQTKFSKLLKVSPATIGQWERGENKPSAKQIPKLMNVLQLDIIELMKLIKAK